MIANAGNPVVLTVLVPLQVIDVTMVYGPNAAFLVECFRARIQYTSMSVPYHMVNGCSAGPRLIASSIVASTHNNFASLYSPIAVALIKFVVGSLFLPDTRGTQAYDEDGASSRRRPLPAALANSPPSPVWPGDIVWCRLEPAAPNHYS